VTEPVPVRPPRPGTRAPGTEPPGARPAGPAARRSGGAGTGSGTAPPTAGAPAVEAPRAPVGRPVVARRVVVTSPRTQAARQARATPRRRLDELADQTAIGDVLIRDLMRAQLGLALRVLAVLAILLGGTPLLFALVPAAAEAEVGGIAVPWLLLGGAAFPLLVLLGVVYVRQAERNEREFAELVEREP
jgi:hypothetical protein